MSFVVVNVDVDKAIKMYTAGKSLNEIGKQFGVSGNTVGRRLVAAGVQLRTRAAAQRQRRDITDAEFLADERTLEAIERYVNGEPALWVTRDLGISYKRFIRLLARKDIHQRTVRETMLMKYAKMTPADRMAIAAAAHTAKRGKPANLLSLEKRAITMERTKGLASRYDLLLGLWLVQRGIVLVPQKAVGRYNVDIAIPESSVIVEVLGDGHPGGNDRVRREYLFDQGWRVIEVEVQGPISALREGAADRIVSLLEVDGAAESDWGQYCVIRGDGEFLA